METFIHAGSANYTTGKMKMEVANYAEFHGCEASRIGSGVDCGCFPFTTDMLCLCFRTYTKVGDHRKSEFNLDLRFIL
ncbi:MAG: hypothetical protein ACJAR3_001546 [Roseivirga sp.]